MKNKTVIIGSINTDIVYQVENLPVKGETINAMTKTYFPGGKGYNQAVAASKFSSEVYLIGKIGNDSNGEYIKETFDKVDIDFSKVLIDHDNPTGEAIILVDNQGNNMISVLNGTNMILKYNELPIVENATVLMQLEVPLKLVLEVIKQKKNNIIILNMAPYRNISIKKLIGVDILVLNEVEGRQLVGDNDLSYEEILIKLHNELLESRIIITLGGKGVIYYDGGIIKHKQAFSVDVIDTTGAGDTFVGVLAGMLNRVEFEKAIEYANVAAALSTTKMGAQSAMPSFDEVDQFIRM